MDFSKTAFLFPGQGSQMVGMGKDVAAEFSVARQTFEEADELLGLAFSKLCFDGPENELNETINTQPALYICSIAILRVLQAELGDVTPGYAAGHSLGELTALTAAGSLSFADGVRLVRERARLMQEAGQQHPGAMAALLGLDANAVRDLCARASQQTNRPVVLANDNCPGQIVISGDPTALDAALAFAAEAGSKRTVRLAVSVAAHSPLMASAGEAFQARVAAVALQQPRLPVYANVSAQPLRTIEGIRQELNEQLTQAVRWTDLMQAMIADGAERFYEIGSKDVLCGLLKRIDRAKSAQPVNNVETIRQLIQTQN